MLWTNYISVDWCRNFNTIRYSTISFSITIFKLLIGIAATDADNIINEAIKEIPNLYADLYIFVNKLSNYI